MTDEELNQIKEAREACATRAEDLYAEAEALSIQAEIAKREADDQMNTVIGWDNVIGLLCG